MEQNEQVICTISKYKIYISNQDFITQKEKKTQKSFSSQQ